MSSPTLELKDQIVRAGAGAGKTTGLVNRIVEVYRSRVEGGEAPRIILTTFTRKATQELKERLILRACHEKDPHLLQFVTDSTRLHISTIHGLLNLFLKQVGHLAGLDSGFQIVRQQEGVHLARLALREVLVDAPDSMRWLEIYGFSGLLRLCRAFAERRAEQGELAPAELSDLQAARDERSDHWRGRFSDFARDVSRSTTEPAWLTFAEELRNFTPFTALPPSRPRKSRKPQPDLEGFHEAAEALIKTFKRELENPWWDDSLWPEMVKEWREFHPFAMRFALRLSEAKSAQARFEMSDLELKALEIIREKPFLAESFRAGWDFWMIDEYQDTSPVQVSLLKALAGEKPKYLVGDPQQSIYLFRGSDVRVFNEAESEIRARGGALESKIKNYRSTPNLLMWINDFMAAQGGQFERMEPRAPVEPPTGTVATFYRAETPELEREGLVARVAELLAEGARLEQICVIARTHRALMDISAELRRYGYPTHVHAARGFASRREVMDARALWKFLVNPHDNLNLLTLLRSPWFFCDDWRLAEWMESRPHSLWNKLSAQDEVPESLTRLREVFAHSREMGLLTGFEKALTETGLMDLCLENDPAGRKESNLWKLIARAHGLAHEGGEPLLNLVESEGDDLAESVEGDATSAQEPNCINLMTIHGSKGLQFDHVLIPCAGEAPRASNVAQFCASEGKYSFPVWFDRGGDSRNISSPLDFTLNQKQRAAELQEFDRWLYVAVTRAKCSVTLSWSQVKRDSWADRNRWFLKAPGEVSTENYKYTVRDKMPKPAAYASTAFQEGLVRAPYSQAAAVKETRRSVSDLLEREERRVHTSQLLRQWQAQTTGTQIHRALEAVKYGRAPSLAGKENEAVDYVLNLQDPPLQRWIQSGEAEWGFQVLTKSGVIEGQIDLWCKDAGQLYVVDYKSGSTREVEDAFKQLSLYAWALRKFGHNEPATLIVVYPLARKVERRPFSEELFRRWEVELGRPE